MLLTDDQVDRIGPDGLIHDAQRLKELQALSLNRKIGITIARIIEFYNYFNGNVYISFSGGKDSTVLLHIARQLFPDIPAVFSNTGLEYPELQKFVKSFDNVVTVYPSMRFPDVIGTYGYPLISKEVSEAIYYARRISPPRRQKTPGPARRRLEMLGLREDTKRVQPSDWNSLVKETGIAGTHTHRKTLRQNSPGRNGVDDASSGVAGHNDFSGKSMFNKQKWLPIAEYLPVPISMYCCNVMKKNVMNKYSRSTKSYPIMGTMAEESRMRKQAWIRQGCNAFTGKIHSQPMSFWTEQDVLEYIKIFNVDICSVYGDINIVDKKGYIVETEEAGMPKGCKWQCSGCQRTG